MAVGLPIAFEGDAQGAAAADALSFASIWRAPLLPIGLAATLGIVLDRYAPIPIAFTFFILLLALVGWGLARRESAGACLLLAACASVGAAYHHWHYSIYPADDIGELAPAEPRPAVLVGTVEEELEATPVSTFDQLLSIPRLENHAAVLRVTAVRQYDDWQEVSGRVRLLIPADAPSLRLGDEVEVSGRLSALRPPGNPGEFDYARFLQEQRIRAQCQVLKTTQATNTVRRGSLLSVNTLLAQVRGWAQRVLAEYLPEQTRGVAAALLLGQTSRMSSGAWNVYMRTGVIHALAISGQHLAILAMFWWFLFRLLGVRRRTGAVLVALFLVAYALMTGWRPPVARSAVTVVVACGALFLRRQPLPANLFALAWIAVGLHNPSDLFSVGCQLSFLSVAVLYWGASWWSRSARSPLDQLLEDSLTSWQRSLRWLGRSILVSYFASLGIWLVISPLVAARYHLVAPVGVLIGPPVVLLTSIALICGFLMLVSALVFWPLAPLLAGITHWSLRGCDALVTLADGIPLGRWYVGDIPDWWLWILYGSLSSLLIFESLCKHWRACLAAVLVWLCVGMLAGSAGSASAGLRCTFLAVGHGGCTVLQTAGGQTFLYDAGAMSGPEVTRRIIAPFLWRQGVRRLDEVFISHADLDHFNGLPDLLERFAVARVTLTPTFAERPTPAAQYTLGLLSRQNVPMRMVNAGDRLIAGDVEMDVLHPPPEGPEGPENARSMVLCVRHAGHSILLTGDLEGPGLARVLRLPPPLIDVMMSPHHGSRTANTPDLAAWARPAVVVSCQGPPRSPSHGNPYGRIGAEFLTTAEHGAVTIRSKPDGLVLETFLTKHQRTIKVR